MHRVDQSGNWRIPTDQNSGHSRAVGAVEEPHVHDVREDGTRDEVLLQNEHSRKSSPQTLTLQIW